MRMHTRTQQVIVATFFSASSILLIASCKSAQLSGADINACLKLTDFPGMNTTERESIAWLIGYERKVRETTCCAIEPRSSLLAKQHNTSALKSETLSRIDIFEAAGNSDARANLRRNNSCYAALVDLYHDVIAAQRQR